MSLITKIFLGALGLLLLWGVLLVLYTARGLVLDYEITNDRERMYESVRQYFLARDLDFSALDADRSSLCATPFKSINWDDVCQAEFATSHLPGRCVEGSIALRFLETPSWKIFFVNRVRYSVAVATNLDMPGFDGVIYPTKYETERESSVPISHASKYCAESRKFWNIYEYERETWSW